jgi:hypothetical protein
MHPLLTNGSLIRVWVLKFMPARPQKQQQILVEGKGSKVQRVTRRIVDGTITEILRALLLRVRQILLPAIEDDSDSGISVNKHQIPTNVKLAALTET